MIAEEYYQHNNPKISIPKGKTVSFIIQTIQEVPQYFILALNNPEIKLPLNENKLTQILVEQINALLLEKGVSILAQNQYSDLFYGTIGKNKNGGIERFKLHIHGKGLKDCGVVGFIRENDFDYWLKKINNWISELSKTDGFWDENEIIMLNEKYIDFAFLHSIAHRKEDKDISLSHFWIKVLDIKYGISIEI